jgi:glycosyltransferase involved in cell wall biosynthesis
MEIIEADRGKIRVCHIITLLELGGAQQNTLYTAAHLDRRRFAVSLVAGPGGLMDAEAESIPLLRTHWIPELVREVNPVKDLVALVRLIALLRRLRPDLVHTHSSKAGILGRWAAHLAGVNVVVHTVHGFGFHSRMPWLARAWFSTLEAWTAPLTTRFLAVSRANLEYAARRGLFRPERASLIRSGIELSSFRNGAKAGSLRQDLGIPPHAPVVGMVACLKPQKAPVDFVKVAEEVSRRVEGAHFLLVGDGELRPEVEEEVARRSLTQRFHLLGWRRDIPSLFKNLDLLALTSLWEGLPRVVPEAMAASLPVVATRVDGTPEAVVEGETGFLVEPGDVQGMAERICWLLEHSEAARSMGSKGRVRVEEFDIDRMVRRQEALYEELLGPRE